MEDAFQPERTLQSVEKKIVTIYDVYYTLSSFDHYNKKNDTKFELYTGHLV